MNLLCAVAIAAIAGGSPQGTTKPRLIKEAYYLSFEADTLYGLGESGIRSQHEITALLKDHEASVLKALRAPMTRGKFDSIMVRMRVETYSGEVFVVDRHGNVKRRDGVFAMTPQEFQNLRLALFVSFPRVNLLPNDVVPRDENYNIPPR